MCIARALLVFGLGWQLADPAPERPRLQQQIERLGSNAFAEREAASQALALLGAPALDALRQAARSRDLEVRRRALDLVERLELRLESARLLAGKKLRLAYRETPVKTAWADFERQGGLRLKVLGAAPDLADWEGRTVTLATGELGFWQALEQFSEALGLVPEASPPESGPPPVLWVRRGKPAAIPTCFAGALRIRAVATSAPGWGQTPGTVDAPCVLEVLPEPGLAWQGVLDVRIQRAVDDRGQVLQQVPTEAGLEDFRDALGLGLRNVLSRAQVDWSGSAEQRPQVPVWLKLGQQPARQLRELEGTLVGRVLTPLEAQLTINDLLLASQHTFKASDGGVLKVGQIASGKEGPTQIDVEVQPVPTAEAAPLNFGANNRRGMNRVLVWQLQALGKRGAAPALDIQDALGRSLEVVRYNEANLSNGPQTTYSATLHVLPQAGLGPPARLVWLGRRQVTVEVPFSLREIPLP